jgi:serine/threonine-protein phosphatase PGAM5
MRLRPLFLLVLPVVLVASGAARADDKPAARTIVLLRHGHYVIGDHDDPRLGAGLSPMGIAQAHLAAARIAALPFRFDAVYASPLTRAQDTAKVIAADLPGITPTTEPEIEECTPPFRGSVKVEDTPDQQAACASHLEHIFATHFKPATGQERRELLVCHGNVIRYLVARSLGVDTKAWPTMSFAHASFTTLKVFPDGHIQLLGAGDTGHLPVNLTSFSSGDDDRVVRVPAH